MADVPPDPIDARIQLLMGAVVGGFKGKPVTALSDEELVKASRFAEGMLRHGSSTEHPVARTLILAAHAEACVRIGQCLQEKNKLPQFFGGPFSGVAFGKDPHMGSPPPFAPAFKEPSTGDGPPDTVPTTDASGNTTFVPTTDAAKDIVEEGPAQPSTPLFQPGTGMKRTAKD